jgi:hypothetical protein
MGLFRVDDEEVDPIAIERIKVVVGSTLLPERRSGI